MGNAKRYVCLDSDLKRIDENTKIVKLPTQGSASYQVEELERRMMIKNPALFESRMNHARHVDIDQA